MDPYDQYPYEPSPPPSTPPEYYGPQPLWGPLTPGQEVARDLLTGAIVVFIVWGYVLGAPGAGAIANAFELKPGKE
jgi:hypothetical protein